MSKFLKNVGDLHFVKSPGGDFDAVTLKVWLLQSQPHTVLAIYQLKHLNQDHDGTLFNIPSTCANFHSKA